MWGQPPSAVRASVARRLLAAFQFPSREQLFPYIGEILKFLGTLQPTIKPSGASLRRTAEGGCPHMVLAFFTGFDVPLAFYRRQLPHLQVDEKPHFVTFCTERRWILPETVRSIVLQCCLHDNGKKYDLKAAIVMPDHVHLIFTPLIDYDRMEVWSLAKIMDAIKGASAHKINRALGRKGSVWQPESFDHVLRCSENLDAKIAYLLENPVRRGLVRKPKDYPWLWQKAFVNPFAPSV